MRDHPKTGAHAVGAGENPSIGFAAAIVGMCVVGPLSLTIFIPALPAIQQAFGADVQLVQLTVSLPLVAVIAAVPLAGGLSDRIGRRPVVLAGVAILMLGCILCVAATSLGVLIVGRVVVGASGTCLLVVARAIISDAYQGDDLTRAMARFIAPPVLVVLVAPLLGGVLTEAFGWRSVFVVLAAIAAALGGLTRWLPESRMAEPRGGMAPAATESVGARSRLLRSPEFWGYAWQAALQFAAAVGFVTAAPYLMVSLLGRSAAAYGAGLLLVVGAMLLGVLIAERLATRLERVHQVLIGCLVGVAAGALTPGLLGLAAFDLSPEILFGPAICAALGVGFALPAAQAGVVAAVPAAAGLASGFAAGLKMLLAALATHVVAIPWAKPGLALGWIGFVAMMLATVAVVVSMLWATRLARLRDDRMAGIDGG